MSRTKLPDVTVKYKGAKRLVSRRQLERLRMLADWQLKEEGYDPASVTRACQVMDEGDQVEDWPAYRYPFKG